MADDAETILETAVACPAEAHDKAGGMTQHSLKDLMAYADRQAAKTAAAQNHMGLRFVKLVPPGGG